MTKRLNLKKLLTAALLLIGVAFVQTAFAQTTWSVSITDTGNPCKFKIERTGDISQAVTVKYRTVSLSAFEGQHFTAVSGDVTFQPDDYEKFIDVAESTPIDSAYMFQNGTSRSYRFEVTDMGGFYLARCDRTKTTGTSVPSSGAFAIKDVTINSGEITVTHGGYDQAFHPMTVGNYFNNAAPRPYLQYIGAQLRMTLSFQCKEVDDGWQYVQIYANQETSNIDSGGDNGNPGACTFSKYAAGFEHKHGSKDPEYKSYIFPVTTVGDNVGATDPWGHGNQYNLYLQRFNNSRASDGRLIIPTNLTSLYIRYNASGSGGDDWVAKNTVAHIQAVDAIAPIISTNNIKVAGGIHGYGNTVYISVPFTEIVTVSGTPKLNTTWCDLSYISGSGSNVLTFSGTITANVGTSLTVRRISGTVKDLADNPYNTNTAINKSFGLTVERPWPGSGSQSDPYIITNAMQLNCLANEVRRGNSYHGTYFKLGADIDMNGEDFLGIGGDYAFSGTFDGDGKTVSNVVVDRGPFSNVGFFGRLSDATVKNLVLDNISFIGSARVGILAGRADNSSIENCLVMNSNVSSNDFNYVGIIAGYPGDSDFSANYYHGCTYCGTANATNVGVGSEFSSPYDIAGARSVHTLTLPEYVIATSAETVTYNQVTYYASNVSVTLTPEQGFTLEAVSVNGTAATKNGDGTWSFTMPAEDATVTALMGVLYIDEKGDEQICTDFTAVGSSYAFGDWNGQATLGVADATERWYAVVGTVSLDKPLIVYGNARLILCDGAALNLNIDAAYDHAAFNIPASNGSDFTIYGQAQGTGTLRVTNTREAIIIRKNTTINGGSVIASSSGTGIIINDTLTINRGTVTATATGIFSDGILLYENAPLTQNGGTLNATATRGNGISLNQNNTLTQNGGTLNATGSYGTSHAGIFARLGSTINILGGIVNATGTDGACGIRADDCPVYILGGIVNATGSTYGIDVANRGQFNFEPIITLGWTTPDDRITASSIHLYQHNKTILQVRDGQTLTDGEGGLYSGEYSGRLGQNVCDVMAGKTLRGCIVREVAGYGSSTTNGWNLIASPVGTVNLADVPHLFYNQYDLYYFDQTGGSNGKEWKNHKAHCSDAENPFNAMVGGQGYLYANSENVTLLFMGAPYNGDGEVTLTKADGFELSGWNLIGNPFNTAATLDKPFYRMNESGSALTAQVEANNSVAAMEGVFVQASTHNETATFTPLASPSRGDHRGGVPMLNIHLSQNRGEVIDNAILRFDDGQTLEKFSFRKDSPKIYLPQGGKDYAIATVGRDAARHVSTNEVPVNFDAKENGTYTLSFNFDGVELEYLHLIDNLTGADVDLLGDARHCVSTAYTFAAKTTDYPSRFKLIFNAAAASTGSAADEAFAYIDASGNIIITADAHGASLQVIDMMGHINVSIDGNTRCVPTAGMTPGVYVLRLIDGENVRTQKMVIE